ncbi:cytochrome c [Candidatus Sumerlaeota bacterium]|nr:cytochrome c [Candidatus Sumerlaeota bacterium]
MPHPFGHLIPSEETFPEMVHHVREDLKDEHHFEKEFETKRSEEAVMIECLAKWLYSISDKNFDAQLIEPPAEEGDPAKGKELVSKVNCLGCHKLDDLNAEGQGYGPDLSKIGSKTNRKWLFNWLKDPKKYWPDGNMPNPRLEDAEINDIIAYLLTLKDDAYMAAPRPEFNEKLLEEIAVRYKRAKLPEEKAKAEVAALSKDDKMLYVGEETMYRRGCFGCHEIKGYENRARIGTELTSEGFKEIELFDFGMHKYVHIPHTRHDWIKQKVEQPGIYFLGKVTNPYEQTFNMPWFGFSDEDANEIATYILGQTGRTHSAKYRYELTGTKEQIVAKQAMIRGKKIIERRNCTGCHPVGLGWRWIESKDMADSKELLWATDPLVAHYDPNLPDGKYSKIDQIKPDDIKKDAATGEIKDKVIVPPEGFLVKTSQVVFGEDYLGMDQIFGEQPVEVNVGAKDEIRIALERPDELKVNGVGEGFIARYYSEAALAPPVLRREGAKINPYWFFKFLKKVETIRNHIAPLRMPQWDWTDEDATDVVKYFSVAAGEKFPFETVDIPPLADIHKDTAKDLFGLPGTEGYDKSLKCLSCHPTGDLMPTNPKESWGPNLYLAQSRLKFSFVQSWLTNPQGWAPGTKMPNFFYDRDGDKIIEVHPTPLVEQIGSPEAIHRLAEMLYHMPEIEEVKIAAAKAAEAAKNAPPPAASEEFMDDDSGDGGAKKKSSAPEEFVDPDDK